MLIVIAKARCIGKCNRLKSNGKSIEIIGFYGISTFFPLHLILMIMTLIKSNNSFLTASIVPLQNFGGFKLQMNINSEPTLNVKMYGGIPDDSNELRNTIG